MEQGGGHEIGGHHIVSYLGLMFNMDTLYMTWLAMAIVILVAFLATRRLTLIPTGWQNAVEMIVTALLDQIEETMGPKGKKVAPLIITLFMFLLVANWQGLIPGLSSPTNDLNTTLGLALMVVGFVQILGIIHKGPVAFIKHFFKPFIPFVIINIVEEISKPLTLSFRLFGNILAGEILIEILGKLVPWFFPVPNVIWLLFSVFVGVVQAFIFTILSLSYLSSALQDGH